MAAAGEKLFNQVGCSGCHGASSKIHAPRLEGLYGNPVPLDGGQVVTADDKYIRDSILLPASQIVAGYQNLMPSFHGPPQRGGSNGTDRLHQEPCRQTTPGTNP